MTLRNIALVAGAVAGLTATALAQAPTRNQSKAPPKPQAATVTITGCVAQGIDADHFVLANGVRREQPPASTAVAGKSPTVRSDKAGASDRTGPYDLEGGEFKGHLGHTVEVTGTSGSTGKATQKPADTDTATVDTAPDKKPLPRFNVLSVKMLSNTCS